MSMKRHEKFFAAEIGIEFKAALYFYSILLFYIGFLLINGQFHARIAVILEMIAATYIMGYAQVFLLGNFDEAEQITASVVTKAIACSAVYTAASFLLGWFDRNALFTAVFFAFMLIFYACSYWLYSFRRRVSTKELNTELEHFKQKKITHYNKNQEEIL